LKNSELPPFFRPYIILDGKMAFLMSKYYNLGGRMAEGGSYYLSYELLMLHLMF